MPPLTALVNIEEFNNEIIRPRKAMDGEENKMNTRSLISGLRRTNPSSATMNDRKADETVYRDGTWYLLRSSQGFAAFPFGIATEGSEECLIGRAGRSGIAAKRFHGVEIINVGIGV